MTGLRIHAPPSTKKYLLLCTAGILFDLLALNGVFQRNRHLTDIDRGNSSALARGLTHIKAEHLN